MEAARRVAQDYSTYSDIPSYHAITLRNYSHYSVKSVPVISIVDVTAPKNAPQAPRERGMWTAITFMVDLLNLFSGRMYLHKS